MHQGRKQANDGKCGFDTEHPEFAPPEMPTRPRFTQGLKQTIKQLYVDPIHQLFHTKHDG